MTFIICSRTKKINAKSVKMTYSFCYLFELIEFVRNFLLICSQLRLNDVFRLGKTIKSSKKINVLLNEWVPQPQLSKMVYYFFDSLTNISCE